MGDDFLTVDTDADPGFTDYVETDIEAHLSIARGSWYIGVITLGIGAMMMATGDVTTSDIGVASIGLVFLYNSEGAKRTAIEWDVQRQTS